MTGLSLKGAKVLLKGEEVGVVTAHEAAAKFPLVKVPEDVVEELKAALNKGSAEWSAFSTVVSFAPFTEKNLLGLKEESPADYEELGLNDLKGAPLTEEAFLDAAKAVWEHVPQALDFNAPQPDVEDASSPDELMGVWWSVEPGLSYKAGPFHADRVQEPADYIAGFTSVTEVRVDVWDEENLDYATLTLPEEGS